MYASKRTIGKQGLFTNFKRAERKVIKHSNTPNKLGRKCYCQTVTDEHGHVKRTIWHFTGFDAFRIPRRKRRLRKSMADQPK